MLIGYAKKFWVRVRIGSFLKLKSREGSRRWRRLAESEWQVILNLLMEMQLKQPLLSRNWHCNLSLVLSNGVETRELTGIKQFVLVIKAENQELRNSWTNELLYTLFYLFIHFLLVKLFSFFIVRIKWRWIVIFFPAISEWIMRAVSSFTFTRKFSVCQDDN